MTKHRDGHTGHNTYLRNIGRAYDVRNMELKEDEESFYNEAMDCFHEQYDFPGIASQLLLDRLLRLWIRAQRAEKFIRSKGDYYELKSTGKIEVNPALKVQIQLDKSIRSTLQQLDLIPKQESLKDEVKKKAMFDDMAELMKVVRESQEEKKADESDKS